MNKKQTKIITPAEYGAMRNISRVAVNKAIRKYLTPPTKKPGKAFKDKDKQEAAIRNLKPKLPPYVKEIQRFGKTYLLIVEI